MWVSFLFVPSASYSPGLSGKSGWTWLGETQAASSGRREARGQRPGALAAEQFERLDTFWVFFIPGQRLLSRALKQVSLVNLQILF